MAMRVAVLGFGFSGGMVVANLVRAATAPLTIYIVAEETEPRGVAYSTQNPEHLLNVRASNMGAFADQVGDFAHWLTTDEAKQQQARLGISGALNGADFAPRMLFGGYLTSIWQRTQVLSAEKNIDIKIVPTRAVAVQPGETLSILTARGDAIAVDKVVVAVGHETKLILTHIKNEKIVQNPWVQGAFDAAANWVSPVMVMGAGLTAVDMVLSLRRAGYQGEIIACSRSGLMPRVHAAPGSIYSFDAEEIAAHKKLLPLLRVVRHAVRVHGDWRAVIDALRPHTQRLWQGLSSNDQQRLLRRLLPLWGVHRHRMAPQIAARIDGEIVAGTLRIVASRKLDVFEENGVLQVRAGEMAFSPSRILNATGLELNLARSSNHLLRQLLADGLVEPHVTGLGVATDHALRAWGAAHPNLYMIGSLVTGQLLESTAVPELRGQAAEIAQSIAASGE